MAIAYAGVLKDLGEQITVVGRGQASAQVFEEQTGIKPIQGGIDQYIAENQIAAGTQAIIATSIESLMSTLQLLLNAGIRKILIEKPAAISIQQLLENEQAISGFGADIYLAYNRRFYASVLEAEKLIQEDGGLQTMHFEFTEWAHRVEPLPKAEGVKENWFFNNSTHIVDLAFFLAGKPADWRAYARKGQISWHPVSNFSGAGVTDKGVLFSYLSNWESAGRWAIELLTINRRIYLKPLEGIMVQQKGSIAIEEHQFDDTLDKKYKPGLFNQVEAFLKNDTTRLINFESHVASAREIYSKMLLADS